MNDAKCPYCDNDITDEIVLSYNEGYLAAETEQHMSAVEYAYQKNRFDKWCKLHSCDKCSCYKECVEYEKAKRNGLDDRWVALRLVLFIKKWALVHPEDFKKQLEGGGDRDAR